VRPTPPRPRAWRHRAGSDASSRRRAASGKALVKLGDVLEFATDSALRENENVPLDPSRSVIDGIEAYFQREVAPHVPDAWIDDDKRDKKDGALGIVGYEINFNRYFYQYQAPRQLADIDADLHAVEAEIAALLSEVTT
jgi:type I restriction enzyme M protein